MIRYKPVVEIICTCGKRTDIYTTRKVQGLILRYWRCDCGKKGKSVCTIDSIKGLAWMEIQAHNVLKGGEIRLDTSRDSERD